MDRRSNGLVAMMPFRHLAVALLATAAAIVAGQAPDPAELILLNGRVFTADVRTPWAEAVAIRRANRGGRNQRHDQAARAPTPASSTSVAEW